MEEYLKVDSAFDHYIFLGDIFGYIPLEKDVLSFFKKSNLTFILGNHDLYYLKSLSESEFLKTYSNINRSMISSNAYEERYGYLYETCSKYKLKDTSFLFGVPLEKNIILDNLRIILAHGSPSNPFNEYIYRDNENIKELFYKFNFDILALGHTHKSFIYENNGHYIINPGSCTIPRGGGNPSIIICNTNPLSFKIKAIPQTIKYRTITKTKIEVLN
ncbi:MAG: metallophosphoesterase [Ignavibacteriaceae bacterium]|nr:metallophosphoesterase [Ignavibacteriaceae bacterium]